MDKEITASLRQIALQQAAHDYRGDASADEVVKRAEQYFAFLAKDALPVSP